MIRFYSGFFLGIFFGVILSLMIGAQIQDMNRFLLKNNVDPLAAAMGLATVSFIVWFIRKRQREAGLRQ
jgi:uncharacterized membrane protein YdjX (TVP38/TMEM64 family)